MIDEVGPTELVAESQKCGPKTTIAELVRTLGQSGPGTDGEILTQIWRVLTASVNSPFHAAEESALRSLLRLMNATSDASTTSEIVQRWPLTWNILELVFRRIPFFSLAKSLADRKFLVVVRQTLVNLTKKNDTIDAASGKRKRSEPLFRMEGLRTPRGCLSTADAIFGALSALFDRLKCTTDLNSYHRIGAQHIRSLFCLSAADSLAIIAPMLNLCNLYLSELAPEPMCNLTKWLDVACYAWGLHLHSGTDATECATRLSRPACSILNTLSTPPLLSAACRGIWTEQISSLVRKTIVLPSRAEFLTHSNIAIFTTAIEVTKHMASISGPVLFAQALREYRDLGSCPTAKDEQWMKKIFVVIERALRPLDREVAIKTLRIILHDVVGTKSVIDSRDLREVCQTYCLDEHATDWVLLNDVCTYDPSILLFSERAGLSDNIRTCISSVTAPSHNDQSCIIGVIQAMIQSFCLSRNLSLFFELWFLEMSKCDISTLRPGAIPVMWYDSAIRMRGSPPSSLVEERMSPQQLLNLVQWLQDQAPDNVAALYVVTANLAEGITSEQYADVINTKLHDLLLPHFDANHIPDDISALRWAVVSKTVSWHTSDEAVRLWHDIQSELSETLSRSPLDSDNAFEAFRCCHQFWLSMQPDGPETESSTVQSLIASFLIRLDHDLPWKRALALENERSTTGSDVMLSSTRRYTKYIVASLPMFLMSFIQHRADEIPNFLLSILQNVSDHQCREITRDIVTHEYYINHSIFVERLINALTDDLDVGIGVNKSVEVNKITIHETIRLLGLVPSEAFSRTQRERLMKSLLRYLDKTETAMQGIPDEDWNLVLGLQIKVMDRPTFYQDMAFTDLVKLADGASRTILNLKYHSDTLIKSEGISQLYFDVAEKTLRQMFSHFGSNGVEYFQGAAELLKQLSWKTPHDCCQFLRFRLLEAMKRAVPVNFHALPKIRLLLELVEDKLVDGLSYYISAYYLDDLTSEVGSQQQGALDLPLLIALDSASVISKDVLRERLANVPVLDLEQISDGQIRLGHVLGWKLKAFLLTSFQSQLENPSCCHFGRGLDQEGAPVVPWWGRRPFIGECVYGVQSQLDAGEQCGYVKELLDQLDHTAGPDEMWWQLYAIRHAVRRLIKLDDQSTKTFESTFAFVQSDLLHRLQALPSPGPREAKRMMSIAVTLMEKKADCMTQWNVDLVLSAVTTICSDRSRSTVVPYDGLCKLAGIIIQQHRFRFEGHFHLVVSMLSALLDSLLRGSGRLLAQTEESARHFGRLLSAICEPTANSVTRPSRRHRKLETPLDTVTDGAKRSAGRHMYLVLMAYVQILLEIDVPRTVRDALEDGVNAIFDITGPEMRKVLNDGLDESGRAVLREIYKRYSMFGKWTGV